MDIEDRISKASPDHNRRPTCKNPSRRFHRRWLAGGSLLTGLLALCWVVLRSSTKPSRLSYPCQRAALSTVGITLGLPAVAAALAVRRRISASLRTPVGVAVVISVAVLAVAVLTSFPRADQYRYMGPILSAPPDYRARVFSVSDCQPVPTGERFVGLDNLIALMGRDGLKFYASAIESLTSGPGGIIGADDVIVIKINYQWPERGGTNVDLLSGLIRRIVDHPDSFTGEVVVCENSQFVSVDGFDRAENNAYVHERSPHDVVAAFQALGYNVSHYDWTAIRDIAVGEYADGDMSDGYIVYDYDAEVNGRVSYPKFQTDAGTYISLKYGIWDPASQTYDRSKLKFINMPVLKSHGAVYGATSAVKDYMGVVSGALGTNSHAAIATGILGAAIGQIRPADLNIIDAIYINAVPTSGPTTTYTGATLEKSLVCSTDPVAADMWAVKNILIPAFIANGYLPPWPAPSADPYDSTSKFRQYLDNSMYQILAAGFSVTNDTTRIDALTSSGRAGDFDQDADVDSSDYDQFVLGFTGVGGGPVDPAYAAGDFDQDGDIDCEDWQAFQFVWTGSGQVPALPYCLAGLTPPGEGSGGGPTAFIAAAPNPTTRSARIDYGVAAAGRVRLRIFDPRGRMIRTLLDETKGPGEYHGAWDGLNDRGEPVAGGVYFCRLDAPAFQGVKRIVMAR
jgi:hypothetical protein